MKKRLKDQKTSRYTSLLLLIMIIVPTILGCFTLSNQNNNDDSDLTLKTSAGEITIITPLNDTITSPDAGYYPSTYGFENNEISSDPEGWTLREVQGTVNVIEEFDGRKKVVELYDNGFQEHVEMTNIISNKTEGTIEFWWGTDDNLKRNWFMLKDYDENKIIQISIFDGSFYYENGTSSTDIDTGFTVINNRMYHHKIEFNCSTNLYAWYINGSLINDEIAFITADTTANIARFHSGWTDFSMRMYVDAIGYSWDPNYEIGDNLNEGLLLSYENTTVLDWVGYSIDGAANLTIQGNTTIPLPDDGHHSIQVSGTFSGTSYQSNVRYFTVRNDTISIVTPENKTCTSPDAGYYPGTHGFENEEIGTNGTNIQWIDVIYTGGSNNYIIVDEINSHKNVLSLKDDGPSARIAMDNLISQNNGTIEFWMMVNDTSKQIDFDLYSGGGSPDHFLWLCIRENKWQYLNSSFEQNYVPNVELPQNNTWHHVKIIFRCDGAPSYAGLSNSRWKVVIDGIDSGELDRRGDKTAVAAFRIESYLSEKNLRCYIDAMSYSWDPNYEIGDNLNEGLLLSYQNTTELEWQGYSLDGATNITIQGNTTIRLPDDGKHTIQVSGISSCTSYQSDIRQFTIRNDTISIFTPYSTTLTSPDVGYYPGTYGFESDEDNSIPEGWIDASDDAACTVQVVNEYDNHKKVMRLYDQTNAGRAIARKNFISQSSGTIKYWIQATNVVNAYNFQVLNNASDNYVLYLSNWGNHWSYYTQTSLHQQVPLLGGGYLTDPIANQWYHVRIDFESTDQGYLGLSENKWRLTINNVEVSQDLDYYASTSGNVSYYRIQTYLDDNRHDIIHLDAFSYSWDPNYEIGDNLKEGLLLSYENTTALDWQGYSLDGADNVTIQGNTTIKLPDDGSHFIQIFGNSSTGINYQSDIRYFYVQNGSISIVTPNSTTHTSPDAGYFPATHGFENIKNNGFPEDWSMVQDGGGSIRTIQESHNHSKIIELYDTLGGAGESNTITQNFTDQSNGTVEFWVKTSDVNLMTIMGLKNGVTDITQSRIRVNEFQCYNGTWFVPVGSPTPQDDQWYHVRFDFETTTGNYMGLGMNQWNVHINGVKYGSYSLANGMNVNNFYFSTYSFDSVYYSYIDAIGYSWDPNYEIGDNLNEGLLLSYVNTTELDWVAYSLDGAAKITIQGNTTIPMPTGNGLHSIQVFGNTSIGIVYQSDIRYFTLDWEYASLRPTTNYLDIIDDLDLFIEISMNSIGFLKVEETSVSLPTFPYLDNNQTRISFYKFTVFNANFDEDESMISGITLRFYYDPLDVSDPENLRVYHYSSSQGKWISEDVTVNQTGHYVEITITELSWFCFGEFYFPPPVDFPFIFIILIILLSVIGLLIPSSYVVVSKKKKKKKSVIQEKRQELLEEKLTPHEIELVQLRETIPEINREQVTPIHPVESKVIHRNEAHKKPKKEKFDPEKTPLQLEDEAEEKKKVIEETEREMDISEDIDRCVVHKGPIIGINYACPKCKAKYCLKCASTLKKRKENCWVCESPISIDIDLRSGKEESTPVERKKIDLDLILKTENPVNEIINRGDLEMTALSKNLRMKIEQLGLSNKEKSEILPDLITLTTKEQENIVDGMLKLKKVKSNNAEN